MSLSRKSRASGESIIFPSRRPLFYYITDRRRLPANRLAACARKAIHWGVDFIQIREKDLDDMALFRLTSRIVELARGTGCRVLVNGRADIALAAGAHGVHLPSTGLRVSDIRPWVPENFLVGVSAHTMAEIRRAAAQGADYLLVGHIFRTESKLAYGPALGLRQLWKACSSVSLPVLGLGGMKPDLIRSVLDTGAAGIAAISLFQDKAPFDQLKKFKGSRARNASAAKQSKPLTAPRELGWGKRP
jgi:thiamine-phosphate pyrophosphorylase